MRAVAKRRYEQAVQNVRALLDRWIGAGIDLFLELRKIEHSGWWKAPGYTAFHDFLSAEFPNTIGIERYNNVMQAIELHGEKFVRKVGVHNCHAIAIRSVAEDPKVAEMVRNSLLTHIERHGVPPEATETRKIVKGVIGEPAKPRPSTLAVTALARAHEEIRALRAKVRELEAECERLRRMVKSGTTEKRGARKPSRRSLKSQGPSRTGRDAN